MLSVERVFELVIFFLFSAASGNRNRRHRGTCSNVPSGFSWRCGSGEVQLPAEADAERVQRRHSDNAGWAAPSRQTAPMPLPVTPETFIFPFQVLISK